MPQADKLDVGYTFEFFIHAVFVFIAGGLSFFIHYILAILIIPAGILLLMIKTGIEVDRVEKRVRKYYNIFSHYSGRWYGTTHLTRIELRLTYETQRLAHRGGDTTIETKTYDLILMDKFKGETELYEFSDYSLATKALKLIKEIADVECRNKIEEARDSAMNRRKGKDYRK